MKKLVLLLSLMVAATMLTNCSSTSKITPGALVYSSTAKYQVVGTTTAKASATTILGFITLGTDTTYGKVAATNASLGGFLSFLDPVSSTKKNAMYKALVKLDKADAIMVPKWTVKQSGVPFLFMKSSVIVTAKGIKYVNN